MNRRFNAAAYAWLSPALAMLAIFLFYPILFNLALSFFEWDGFQRNPFGHFVSLANFVRLAGDPIFLTALRNTVVFVFFAISVQNAVALGAAIFLFLGEFRGAGLLRAIIFFPGVLSAVVVSLVWRNIVLLRDGLIHQVTRLLGLPELFPLGDPRTAFYVIIIVAIWQSVGFNLVIFNAGLQALDREVVEAAEIDGAGFWPLVRLVVVPLQARVILTCVMLNLIGGFQVFDLVFVMTRAGPVHATEVLASYMIYNAFTPGQYKLGYAAAIATMMMALTLFFAAFRARASRRLAD